MPKEGKFDQQRRKKPKRSEILETLSRDGGVLCGTLLDSGLPCQEVATINGRCEDCSKRMRRLGIKDDAPDSNLFARKMPKRLLDGYQRALDDPQLDTLRRERAILTTLLEDKLTLLDDASPDIQWGEAIAAWEDVFAEYGDDSPRGPIAKLGMILKRGSDGAAAEMDVRAVIQEITNVAKVETVRLEKAGQFVTKEQLIFFCGCVAGIMQKKIADTRTVDEIQIELMQLMYADRKAIRPAFESDFEE